jgi:pimeloyl-ACP methyl ester carboxylesterase
LNKLVLPWGELAYFKYGSGKKRFLFVHNAGGNHFFLAPLIESLQAMGEVVAPDLRGHGESQIGSGPYSVASLGEDLLDLVQSLGEQKVILVGLNYGATLCEWMARRAPDIFSHLILLEPPLFMSEEVRQEIEAHIHELKEMKPKEYAAHLVASIVKGDVEKKVLEAAFEKTPQNIQAEIYQELLAYDRELVVEKKLFTPTLLMRSEESFSKEGVWQELYDPFKEVVVKRSGPWLSLEQPHFVTKEIKQFIKEYVCT